MTLTAKQHPLVPVNICHVYSPTREERCVIALATAVAHSSDVRHRHGAVISNVKDGGVLSVSCNKLPESGRRNPQLHAEARALRSYTERYSKFDSEIFMVVVRVSKTGILRMSKPCGNCFMRIARQANLSYVLFSDGEGNFGKMFLTAFRK